MRKLYNSLLFFTFILVFSAFAADETSKPFLTVKTKASQMSDVIGILELHGVKLKETAFFFDFDETLGMTVVTYKSHNFEFLPCPDRIRTYKEVFSAAFQNSSFKLENFDLMDLPKDGHDNLSISKWYMVLDDGAKDLVCELCENARFVGVCSALPGNSDKNRLMKYVGLDKKNYFYASEGKPQAIYDCLAKKIKKSDKKITTIVLLDNSAEFAIVPFLKDMPLLAQQLGFTHLNIIGIEFTKFSAMATQEAIAEELTLLDTLCKGK